MKYNGLFVKFNGIAHEDVGGTDIMLQTIEPSVAGVVSIVKLENLLDIYDASLDLVAKVKGKGFGKFKRIVRASGDEPLDMGVDAQLREDLKHAQ